MDIFNGEYPPGVFSSKKAQNFETPYFFPYKFDTPYIAKKLGLLAFLIFNIATIFAIVGSVNSKKMDILKTFWTNFEIEWPAALHLMGVQAG